MTTLTLSKTIGTALLAHTQQATAVVTVGSAISVTTEMVAQIYVKMGRTVATALSNEIKFRLEASAKASANDEWYPVLEWTSASGKTACNSTTLNGATTAGNTTSILTSGTGFSAGARAYFRETGTPANSEWSRVKSLSSNTVTFEEGQTRDHTNSINVATLAEDFAWVVDLSAISRIRLIVDSASAASGQTVDVIAWVSTLDSMIAA
jgi:hypothetical protein